MGIRKTLRNILLSSALALTNGCGVPNPEYQFSGEIGTETVTFYQSRTGTLDYQSKLIVRKDGSEITYTDSIGDDLLIDYISITTNKGTVIYRSDSKNPDVEEVMKNEQKKFEEYLSKIHEINTSPLNS